MSAIIDSRRSTPTLPLHPNVLLTSSERALEGPFAIVTQSLLSLGSCPIESLAHSPKADLEVFGLPTISSDVGLPPGSSQPPPGQGQVASDDKEAHKTSSSMHFVAQLHSTCVGAFGNSEALKFEFLEEAGRDHKQCILTITRPNGQTRSYVSEAEYERKSDAKARAATLAIEMGAVDFILHGNKDTSKARSKLILAPLDSTASSKPEADAEEESPLPEPVEDDASTQIEDLCAEWRAGQVQPRWVLFQENRSSQTYGCVLVIELSPHSRRLYSVGTKYSSRPLAKKNCSEAAIRQDVIEFIKHGNGQTTPAPFVVDPLTNAPMRREPRLDRKSRLTALSLQEFYESLPRPFPEPVGDNPVAANLNAPGMLNTTLQLAKGARVIMHFFFLNENGLHGAIIRLERPGETKTYLVDAQFSKRSDAKAAVCLQAMSQGVSQYIRTLAAEVDSKISPEMRKQVNEVILPILGSEYGRLRHGMHPGYSFNHEDGAFSCEMELCLGPDAKPGETKKWTVGAEYRTKIDAKTAVLHLAGADAINFVRFRGETPPPGHDPLKPYKRREQMQGAQNPSPIFKRETSAEQQQQPNRAMKPVISTSGLVRLGLPVAPILETRHEGNARMKEERARKIAAPHWEKTDLSPLKGNYRRPSSFSFEHAPGPSRWPEDERQTAMTRASLDVNDAASAVINRLTGPSSFPAPPSQLHRPALSNAARHSPSPPQRSSYSPSEPAALRPARKPRPHPPPSSSQHIAPSQPSPQQHPPSYSLQNTNKKATPPKHSPLHGPQPQSTPYGDNPPLPHYQSSGLSQPAPYPPGPYTTGSPQLPPYPPYPMPPGVQYPHPPNGYPFPVPPTPPVVPPAYGVPPYHTYAAFYSDPRYAQYLQMYTQYAIPGMHTMPYAGPLPPTPNVTQNTPPPTHTTIDTDSAEFKSGLRTPPSTVSTAEPERTESAPSPTRTTSFSAANDRQKRPRSRDMSMSPDDAQLHKKHRSESSLPLVDVKRESVSASPAPQIPLEGSETVSNVEQLLRYCDKEGIAWPEFGSKQMRNADGRDAFEVWIVMGKERLELPVTFQTENEGRQRVARQVLQRLRSQSTAK